MRVVAIPLHDRVGAVADGRRGQPVAPLAGLDQAGFVVRVLTTPSGIGGLGAAMDDRRQIARGVVCVLLHVRRHCGAIARRPCHADTWMVVMRMRERWGADLAE